MKKMPKLWRGLVVWMATCSLLTAQLAPAAGLSDRSPQSPVSPGSLTGDVALGEGGLLQGHVLDAQGAPRAGIDVVLSLQGRRAAAARTDADGRFAMAGVPAGVYQLDAAGARPVIVRLWAPQTAPPSARTAALLVASDPVVRGQQRPILSAMASPWVLGGIVAAAIAIPLAVDHNGAS